MGVVALSASVALTISAVLTTQLPASASGAPKRAAQLLATKVAATPTTKVAATPLTTTHPSLTSSGLSTAGRSFSYGYDLTQYGPYDSVLAPAMAARKVAQSVTGSFEDVPIMGWGTGNPEPSNGVFNFAGIAQRIAFVEASGGIPVITLCAAPDWMKGGLPGVTDWSQINVAPLPQHYADFATLSADIAKAFPQVKYFVVWNELKGFEGLTPGSPNVAGYTTMYNDVYRAVKAVRPDALVGGPYVSVQSLSGPSTGSNPTPSGAWGHLSPTSLADISYWLTNKVGADFIAVDGRGYTDNAGLTTDPISAMAKYAAVDQWLETQTTLPIVWMESHVLPVPGIYSDQMQAAVRVAALLQMASSGASVGMQWDPEDLAGWDEGIWTASESVGGGQSTVLGQELPAVLAVLAAPVTLVPGEPAGTLVATGADGTVTVKVTTSGANVTVSGTKA